MPERHEQFDKTSAELRSGPTDHALTSVTRNEVVLPAVSADAIASEAQRTACLNEQTSRLAALIARHQPEPGFSPVPELGINLIRSHISQSRGPFIYEPGMVIVAQGDKIGFLGNQVFEYNPGKYLVQMLPLPFECQHIASPEVPLLAVSLSLDMSLFASMARQLLDDAPLREASRAEDCTTDAEAMTAIPMHANLSEALIRLLSLLDDPQGMRVLGEARLKEVMYEALRGPYGSRLQHLLNSHSQFSRIFRALGQLHSNYTSSLNVDALASQANMSTSSFHQHFRQITATSPLQYIKRLRLLRARQLIYEGSATVSSAAMDVGYESPSQFSREYKRYFGVPPKEDRAQAATALTA
ncbi:AraC family transcriptional regulator N-terminal domain-containing protein [Pokkaliibacter sp. CJK22405]|uniref:AraC family transcriptional regulator n=1 Tax=Pokkaliibacter sp. CJK22405 TaxID=3384615 RepID=UPI003984B66B